MAERLLSGGLLGSERLRGTLPTAHLPRQMASSSFPWKDTFPKKACGLEVKKFFVFNFTPSHQKVLTGICHSRAIFCVALSSRSLWL